MSLDKSCEIEISSNINLLIQDYASTYIIVKTRWNEISNKRYAYILLIELFLSMKKQGLK